MQLCMTDCLYLHLNLNLLYCQIDVSLPLNKKIHADLGSEVMNLVIDWVLPFELVQTVGVLLQHIPN